jgi:hypothetical protein
VVSVVAVAALFEHLWTFALSGRVLRVGASVVSLQICLVKGCWNHDLLVWVCCAGMPCSKCWLLRLCW